MTPTDLIYRYPLVLLLGPAVTGGTILWMLHTTGFFRVMKEDLKHILPLFMRPQ